MVYARTSSAGGDGVTCFLVEGGTPGFSLGKGAAETGWRSQVIAPTALMFRDCAVPAEAVLGEEGRAFHLGRRWLPSRRIVRGARSVGVAQRLLEEASTQAQSWQSFGQFVSRRLDIESALADVATDIHACRLVVHEAACKSDEGQLTRRGAAVVKVFASGMLGRVADRVAHVFNGPPYLEGLAMEKLCRDVMATRSLGLAMELQRSIIAGDILKGLKV
jgi:alkylation response protein AidB-like acyl-CoA dehydrogenase